MGCWNGTCGISQLPIMAGMKVKAFLMLQSEFVSEVGGAGVCYPTAYFRPWFFPVTAEYNDYGSVENIQKDWNSEYMLESFRKWLAEGKVRILEHDEAEINDPNIAKFKSLNDVFDCVERGALVFKSTIERLNSERTALESREVEFKIGIFMVLEGVFNELVAESFRFGNLDRNEYYHKQDAKDQQEVLDRLKKIRTNKVESVVSSIIRDMKIDLWLSDSIEEHYAFHHYKPILYAPDKVTVDEFMLRLQETKNIGQAMSFLRKLWIPQTGQGSQSEELSFNKALVTAMNNHFINRAVEEQRQLAEEKVWEKKYKAEQAAKKNKKL